MLRFHTCGKLWPRWLYGFLFWWTLGDSVECRRVLEACGWRMSWDCVLIFLVSAKGGQIVAQGISVDALNFALGDLYQRPPVHGSLRTYWDKNPPLSELHCVKRMLQQISELEVGSVMVLALLQELMLFMQTLNTSSHKQTKSANPSSLL